MSRCVLAVLVGLVGAGWDLAYGQTASIGANFTSIDLTTSTSLTGFSFEPPDTMGAVGISNYVQFNNGSFSVFNKSSSTPISRTSDSQFWINAGVSSSLANNISDPRIVYDPQSQRWFASQITTGQSTNNSILVARSNTSDPTQGWKAVTITLTNGEFGDFPTLGLNATGLSVSTTNFTSATGTSTGHISLFSIPKVDLLAATPTLTHMTNFGNLNQTTVGNVLQPVNDFGPGGGGLAVLGTHSGGSSVFSLTTINGNSASGATLSSTTNIPVTSYTAPPTASQSGTSNKIDAGDERFSAKILEVGNLLYMVNSTRVGSRPNNFRTAINWTVVNATTHAVVAQGTIPNSGGYNYYPSIAANASGDVVIGYTSSSSSQFASAFAVVGSTTNFTSWTFGTPIQLKAGSNSYSGTRWGDYSATSVDPADPGIFWTTQEFAPSNANTGNWATQVTELIPTKAGEVRWQLAANGTFSTGSSWFTGAAPGVTDHAIFSRPDVPYTVAFSPGTTSNDRASVRQGTVTFNLPAGTTYALTNSNAATPSLAIAEFQGVAGLTVSGGGTLLTVNTLIAGTSGGTGTLTVSGAGTTWNNSGGVFIGGTSTAAGGTGSLTVQSGAAAAITGPTTLWQSSSAMTINAGTLSTGGLSSPTATTPTISLTDPSGGTALTLNPGAGQNSVFSGTLGGGGSLLKLGAGTQTLAGASTYTGTTTIQGGTLIVNNTTGSGTGTSTVQVNTAGTLSGTGSIGGPVIVSSGGVITPGDPTQANPRGNLTITNSLNISAAGTYSWKLGNATTPAASQMPGIDFDRITINGGALTLGGTSALTLDFSALGANGPDNTSNPFWQAMETWTIIDVTGGATNSSLFGSITDPTSQAGVFSLSLGTGGVVQLQFTPTPEPAWVLLMAACGAIAICYLQRHRHLTRPV